MKVRDNGTRLIKREMRDLMMYMIGFAPRLDDGIFDEVYLNNEDRWSIHTVNTLIEKCNEEWGMDINKIEVKVK